MPLQDPFSDYNDLSYILVKNRKVAADICLFLNKAGIASVPLMQDRERGETRAHRIQSIYTPPTQPSIHDGPQKCMHVGVTETAMLLALNCSDDIDREGYFVRNKLWRARTVIGYYNSNFTLPVDPQDEVTWETHGDTHVTEYFTRYLASCQTADTLFITPTSVNDAMGALRDGETRLRNLFPTEQVAGSVSFNQSNAFSKCKPTVIVSPFAELMREQVESGNMQHLRPDFQPSSVHYVTFPYCFMGTGPHTDSL